MTAADISVVPVMPAAPWLRLIERMARSNPRLSPDTSAEGGGRVLLVDGYALDALSASLIDAADAVFLFFDPGPPPRTWLGDLHTVIKERTRARQVRAHAFFLENQAPHDDWSGWADTVDLRLTSSWLRFRSRRLAQAVDLVAGSTELVRDVGDTIIATLDGWSARA
ncbi:MAG: hypothetical protein JOZ39_09300 [Chloroflexi bacterium]|nr:hypothetical protein [Chloroflexota bacterium]